MADLTPLQNIYEQAGTVHLIAPTVESISLVVMASLILQLILVWKVWSINRSFNTIKDNQCVYGVQSNQKK